MDKILETLAFLGRFPIHTGPTPPLTPQSMLDACIQNCFRVSTLYRLGGERTARKLRKGCTVLRGDREMTEKYEYCSTVPRTFVQDWSFNHSISYLVCWSEVSGLLESRRRLLLSWLWRSDHESRLWMYISPATSSSWNVATLLE